MCRRRSAPGIATRTPSSRWPSASPKKAAMSMEAFVTHPVWWVRMYAAGAAAVAGDLIRLEKLAYDSNDNVREAALEPLRRLKKAEADPAIVAALDRTDVQLLRTAAMLLKDSPPDQRTVPAARRPRSCGSRRRARRRRATRACALLEPSRSMRRRRRDRASAAAEGFRSESRRQGGAAHHPADRQGGDRASRRRMRAAGRRRSPTCVSASVVQMASGGYVQMTMEPAARR